MWCWGTRGAGGRRCSSGYATRASDLARERRSTCVTALAGRETVRYRDPVDYSDIITIEAGKRGGKPCIRGLRITVYDVLEYLASGMSEPEILREFPDLTADDVRACLAFAADRERRLFLVPAA